VGEAVGATVGVVGPGPGDPPLIASAPTVATSRAAASNPNVEPRRIDRRDLTGALDT